MAPRATKFQWNNPFFSVSELRWRKEAGKGEKRRGRLFPLPFILSRMKQQSARFMKDFQTNLKPSGEPRCQWNARARQQ